MKIRYFIVSAGVSVIITILFCAASAFALYGLRWVVWAVMKGIGP
jgi:hypothetical protein